ncbi:hypothetical protein AB0A81_21100 [Streptomyces flaveolus]|uniref:Uncharacterized protein n=1 Tax=Streptomyces flaveolus TaxID=67297 RepID=A0ABV1VEV0_9ACTN
MDFHVGLTSAAFGGALQTRAGLAALELDGDGLHTHSLLSALTEVARLDAYAACEVLGHQMARALPPGRAGIRTRFGGR